MNKLLLSFKEYNEQAKAIAKAAALNYAQINVHRFPDGESKIILPVDLPEQVIVCRSLDQANEKLLELILVAAALREKGVKKILLLVPYLAYMRQDMEFNPGEVVSQKIIGKLLADYFDAVITVDSHLHRIEKLSEAIPLDNAINLTATKPMAEFLKQQVEEPFLLGPDEESRQWVSAISKYQKLDFGVASKQRFGDKDVQIVLPEADYFQRHIVMVDDVASSGRTLEVAAQQLQQYKPASISVLVTHALFMDDALQRLKKQGVDNIWSCDSVVHESNRISLAEFFADSLKKFN